MTPVALRPATQGDSEFCYQLHKAAMGGYITAIWGWDEQVQRAFHARAFNPARWQIITAGGTDIGMLDVEQRTGEIYLARIELHPGHQSRGIGTFLVSALLDEAARKGKDLVLDVLAVNHRAQALYQRLGMTEVARHGHNNIKITMRSAGRQPVSNPFTSDPAALRYAHGRPFYHGSAVAMAARQLGISHARLAIDVACGTGLSAQALRELADHVIAIDASAAMVRAARPQPRVSYLVATAEQIPLGDSAADLATVAAAFHWFDQSRAFAELARVLRSGAGLAVYSDFFSGQVTGQPLFTSWLKESYLPRYPTPPRHAYFDPAAALPAGFCEVSYTEDTINIPLTPVQLADYLLSQSNAAAAIEGGSISADTLRSQILHETAALLPGDGRVDAVFGIRVWTTVRA